MKSFKNLNKEELESVQNITNNIIDNLVEIDEKQSKQLMKTLWVN